MNIQSNFKLCDFIKAWFQNHVIFDDFFMNIKFSGNCLQAKFSLGKQGKKKWKVKSLILLILYQNICVYTTNIHVLVWHYIINKHWKFFIAIER